MKFERREPEYTAADIREYIRLLERKRRGYDGPDPAQWHNIEKHLVVDWMDAHTIERGACATIKVYESLPCGERLIGWHYRTLIAYENRPGEW